MYKGPTVSILHKTYDKCVKTHFLEPVLNCLLNKWTMKEWGKKQLICTTSLLREPWLLEGIPLLKFREPSEWKRERESVEVALYYHSLDAVSSSPAVPEWGHLGVRSDILSNCIILLSMLTGYVIFRRSVPIIRARLSQRDPPDVSDLLQLDLVFPSKTLPAWAHQNFSEALVWKCSEKMD